MQGLEESNLLRALSNLRKYTAKDVADLLFLYCIGLHILRCDFNSAPHARDYARLSVGDGEWHTWRGLATDMYQFIHILHQAYPAHDWKMPHSSELLVHEIGLDTHLLKDFLHNIQHRNFNDDRSGQYLLRMERMLRVQVTNYRSMRRIASDWMEAHVDHEARSLVVTRLLQAMRHRAFRGDLNRMLEDLAGREKLEIQGACDPETGKNCTVPGATAQTKGPSLLKQLAIGAGLGVGTYLLGKAIFGGRKK